MLDLIGQRFEELSERVKRSGQWTPDLKLFEKLKVRKDSNASIAADVERSLSLPRSSDKERDELLDAEIPRDTGSRQQVFRPVFQHDESRWLACVMLYSRVVRNSELVKAEDKRKGLLAALRGWSDVCVRVMALAPRLAKDRKIRINGVRYVVSSTEEEPDDNKLLMRLFYAIPENVSRLIFQHLGSEKLSRTLAAPLSAGEEAEGELLIITFFRKLLVADLKLPGFPNSLRKLSEELGSALFLREVLLSKLRFMFRVATVREQETLRPVLVQLLRQLLPSSGSSRDRAVSRQLENLKREGLLLRYSERD